MENPARGPEFTLTEGKKISQDVMCNSYLYVRVCIGSAVSPFCANQLLVPRCEPTRSPHPGRLWQLSDFAVKTGPVSRAQGLEL